MQEITHKDNGRTGFLNPLLEMGKYKAEETDTMYIRSVKAVKIKLAFKNIHGVTLEVALLNSRATENFLDLNVWKSMKIEQFKME